MIIFLKVIFEFCSDCVIIFKILISIVSNFEETFTLPVANSGINFLIIHRNSHISDDFGTLRIISYLSGYFKEKQKMK